MSKSFGTILSAPPKEKLLYPDANTYVLPETKFNPALLDSFDGRNYWKLAPVLNQEGCSSCYSFASISALQDRYNLYTNLNPDFNPLDATMCMFDEADFSDYYKKIREDIHFLQKDQETHVQKACKGNTIISMGKYLYRWGATENNCVPFKMLQNILRETGRLPICTHLEGKYEDLCVDNKIAQRIWPIKSYYVVNPEGPNILLDELIHRIKIEVLTRGPIVVAFHVFPYFLKYDGKGIYDPADEAVKNGIKELKSLGGHAVKLVGWSENYWICANSWGTHWGDNGYFKIIQGSPYLRLEDNHICFQPQIPWLPLIKSNIIDLETEKERMYNNVSPASFYPARVLPFIEQGYLQGDLNPLFDVPELLVRDKDGDLIEDILTPEELKDIGAFDISKEPPEYVQVTRYETQYPQDVVLKEQQTTFDSDLILVLGVAIIVFLLIKRL